MTVNSTTSAVSYNGTGSVSSYPYTWQISQDSDLVVYQWVVSTGVITKLVLNTDYTVTAAGILTGGNVVLVAGNLPSGTSLFIGSDPLEVQLLLLQEGAAFNPADLMNALDYLCREVQATRRVANNALQIPLIESLAGLTTVFPAAAVRANTMPAFDGAGNAIVTGGASSIPAGAIVQQIANVAALRLFALPVTGYVVQTRGYRTDNDGGAALYWWNASDTSADNGGTVIKVTAITTGRWNLFIGSNNVKQFGAYGDGLTAGDDMFINAAMAQLGGTGGGLLIPDGTYQLTGEIRPPVDGVRLSGESRDGVVLVQTTTTLSHVRVSTQYCVLENLTIAPTANVATSGIRGITFGPTNEADTTVLGFINYNTVRDINISNCNEGMYLRIGPHTGSGDSQMYYNKFDHITVTNSNRGFYMPNGPNITASGVNGNTFIACRVGNSGVGNTGFEIQNGNSNQFIGCAAEGMNTGTVPNATPVGFVVRTFGGQASNPNAANSFLGCYAIACTHGVENYAIRTAQVGGYMVPYLVGTTPIELQLGASNLTDPQSFPLNLQGAIYAQHLSENANLPNDTTIANLGGGIALPYVGSLRPETFDLDGATSYKWAAYNIAPQITNVTVIGAQYSFFYVFGGFCEWHLRCKVNATVVASAITINLPMTPDTNFLGGSMTNFTYSCYVTNGTNTAIIPAPIIAGPALSFTHPSNWAAGTVNEIHIIARFRISR